MILRYSLVFFVLILAQERAFVEVFLGGILAVLALINTMLCVNHFHPGSLARGLGVGK